jgi:putative endopeptidase
MRYRLALQIFIMGLVFFIPGVKENIAAQPARHFLNCDDMDTTVRPGDNFCRYASGNWLKNNPVPDFTTHWDAFEETSEKNYERLHALLDSASAIPNIMPGSATQKLVDLYKAGMDSEAIEKAGLDPLRADLKRIDGIQNVKDLLAEIALEHTEGIEAVFIFRVAPAPNNPTKEMCELRQGGLGLPGKEYYVLDDSRTVNIRAAYKEYIAQMLTLTGDTMNAEKDARRIYRLEAALAEASLDEREEREKGWYKVAVPRHNDSQSPIDLKTLLTGMKVPDQDSVSAMPWFFHGFSVQLNVTPLSTWKKYLQYSLVTHMASCLSNVFDSTHFNFYGRVLQGQKKQQPRWKRIIASINHAEGDLLAQMFVARYYKPETGVRVTELVDNLKQAFAERISKIDWMTGRTKQRALQKLGAMKALIGVPKNWKDYDSLAITNNGYVKNIKASSKWAYNLTLDKLRSAGSRKKRTWPISPLTVNAFYYPQSNEFVLPAGILQFPFFDENADDAVIYGGLGALIGHEMTHGFDNNGRKYDAHGYRDNWWTPEDANNFNQKANLVVDEYNKIVAVDDFHVDGYFGEGENLADLGGLNIAYEAFKKTKQGQSNEKIDGFTPDQRFFLSWVQTFRSNVLPEEVLMRLRNYPHSLNDARCNVPPGNMDAWYKAFDIQSADKMFRPVAQRIRVW